MGVIDAIIWGLGWASLGALILLVLLYWLVVWVIWGGK